MPLSALALTFLALGASTDDDPFVRFDLPGGARLTVMHVPVATHQSTFTLRPFGLADDPAGGAQLSHLAEHLVLRATDPDALDPPGLRINGETGGDLFRLETIAHATDQATDRATGPTPPPTGAPTGTGPGAALESLRRHASWTGPVEIDPAVFEREKGNIAREEATTVAGGFTHKWAYAAWNQVVRHGRDHAAVHGDVVDATADEVRAFVERRVRGRSPVTFVSAGPLPPDEVERTFVEALAELRGDAPPGLEPLEVAAAEAPRFEEELEATWDLDAHQVLVAFPLADETPADRVAARATTLLAQTSLASGGTDPGRLLASAVRVPEGRFLLLSASASGEDELAAVRARLAAVPAAAARSVSLVLFQLKAQAAQVPDVAALRKQMTTLGRDTALVEAQIALSLAVTEHELGLDFAAAREAWRALDADALKAYVERTFAGESGSLVLRPGE